MQFYITFNELLKSSYKIPPQILEWKEIRIYDTGFFGRLGYHPKKGGEFSETAEALDD